MKEIFSKITVIFFSVILLTSTAAISIHPAYSQTIPETDVLIMGPQKDAFLKDGNGNVNEGANSILELKGNARPVIAFDQTLLEQTIEQRPIINATLRLFIEDVGGNLGSGQQTNLHKLNQFWTEGNAAKSGGTIPGTGSGVTWKCPVDSDISDSGTDCSIQWGGGNFNATVSDSIILSNSLTGQFIEFNLTGDVQSILNSGSTDFGWLMKKQNDEGAGTVLFTSKEGTANSPELIIHYDRPEAVLANEYLDLIDEVNTIGLAINNTVVTQSFIDDTSVKLDRIKEIVIELQNLGFDGNATSQVISGSAVGTVSFFDDQTQVPLFDKQIPNGALAIFTSFGLIEEFEGTTGELSFIDQQILINGSLELVEAIITSDGENSGNVLVLSAISAFHPSTGNTFFLAPIISIILQVAITNAIIFCFVHEPECAAQIVSTVAQEVAEILDFISPTISVTGLKFHDKNNDGFHNLPEEVGVAGFNFTIGSASSSLFPIGASTLEDTSDINGEFGFQFKTANKEIVLTLSEDLLPGWTPNINATGNFIEVTINPTDGQVVPMKFGNVLLNSTLGTVDQVSTSLAQGTNEWYSGVKRIAEFDGTLFAFYYDGSNIVYKTSMDNGSTWSSKQSVGTGVLDSDIGRWTIAADNSNHVMVFYYIISGDYTRYKSLRGTVIGDTITFDAPRALLSASPRGTGMASAGTDANGNIHAYIQWDEGRYTASYSYVFTNNLLTKSETSSSLPMGSHPTAIAFTPLDSGKMLWIQGKASNNDLFYRVYDGNSWGGQQTIPNVFNCSSCAKQLSGDSDSTNSPSVAFLSNGNSGEIKIAKWDSNGGFIGVETAENTLSHSLPSLTISDSNIIHVYSISNNIVYETVNDGSWQGPTTPFGILFGSANHLTSAIDMPAALWREGSSSPFNINFGTP